MIYLLAISYNLLISILLYKFKFKLYKSPIGSFFFVPVFFYLFLLDFFFIKNFYTFFLTLIFWFIGILDDLLNLRVITRFIAYSIIIFLILILNLDTLNLSEFGIFPFNIILFTFLILGFIHMMNMIDGINIYYIFYMIISFSILFLLKFETFYILMLMSSLFFLYFNFANKIIIGNSGNYFLSLILCLCFIFNRDLTLNFINIAINEKLILIIFFLPLIDGLKVSMSRILNKNSPFLKDNNHLHFYGKNPNVNLFYLILSVTFLLTFYLTFKFFYLTIFIGTLLYLFLIKNMRKFKSIF